MPSLAYRKKVRQAEKIIISLAGNYTRQQIAEMVGFSRTTVNRCLAKNKIKTGQPRQYKKETVEAVLDFYKEHSISETADQFPGVRVRSIVERNDTKPKILNYWDAKNLIRIIPLLTTNSIADIAKKHGTTESSLNHAISRKLPGVQPKHINGIAYRLIKNYTSINPKKRGNSRMVRWYEWESTIINATQEIKSMVSVLARFEKLLIEVANGKRD